MHVEGGGCAKRFHSLKGGREKFDPVLCLFNTLQCFFFQDRPSVGV